MTESFLPPHNIELEESILSSILTFPDDDLFEADPSDFYRTLHGKIYEVCRKIWEFIQKIDITEVLTELKSRNQLEECGGGSYLSKLMDSPPCVDHIHSISQLKGYANLRRIIELSNAITKKALSARPDDVESLVDRFQSDILKIGSAKQDPMTPHCDLIMECIEHCEQLQQNRGMTGVPTGFLDLDSILCGFQKSDLYILAARPAIGKTAFCLNCIDHAASQDYVSDFYSLEMAKIQMGIRHLSMRSGVNSQKFRSGYFSQKDWVNITEAAAKLSEYKINIDDTPSCTYQQIQRKARKSKKKNGTDIIWIDYVSFIQGDKGLNRNQEVGTITRGLKALAKELEIPVVLVCQLNRMLEQRGNKRPVLSDLRDSGEIEQDADCVLFLYRDDYYNKDEDNPNRGIVEVEVAKQRNGPTGTVNLLWHNKTTRFMNLRT